ncbi:NUDIX hydrolase [Patescibacteria group bacterium]|nr:NUDIX hydrolase [Patescibacteria group bacterium]
MKLVNSSNLIILNDKGEILLAKRVSDNVKYGENGKWSIPGGTVEEGKRLMVK